MKRESTDLINLDLLRTMAVFFVVLRHLFYALGDPSGVFFQPSPMGTFGVYLFFTLTTLVLMFSLERHEEKSSVPFWNRYFSFEIRRAFRIYPLSVLVVVVAFFLLIPNHLYVLVDPVRMDPTTLFSNVLLVQNLNHVGSLIGPLWSLPIEVQMYLVLPLLYGATRTKNNRFLGGLWIVCFAYAVITTFLKHRLWGIDLITFAPCFIPGVICYNLMRKGVEPRYPWWTLPALTLVCLLVFMISFVPLRYQMVQGEPFCLLLAITIPRIKEIPTDLTFLRVFIKQVAKYSYGAYLFHEPAIQFSFSHLRRPDRPLQVLLATAITAVLAVGMYHLLEAPLISLGKTVAKSLTEKRPAAAA